MCKVDSKWEVAVSYRKLSPVLCDNLEGWGRWGVGGTVQEGGDVCTSG